MKTEFKMYEATTKNEAIISILHVLKENPLFLNKCTSQLMALLSSLGIKRRKNLLNECSFDIVKELFIEIKTEYYNSIDYSLKF